MEFATRALRDTNANRDNGGNVNGIKPCPRCARPVQKAGACSHMVCGGYGGRAASAEANIKRGVACGCEFCWICEKEYDTPGSHRCNGWVEPEGYTDFKATSGMTAGANLPRFDHYFHRYEHHKV